MNRQPYQQVIVASHRRSGTHLTIDSLLNNFPCFASSRQQPVNLDTALADRGDSQNIVREQALSRDEQANVWKTHASGDLQQFFSEDARVAELASSLADRPTIYVHRDGRDVMVSLYNYRKKYDPTYAEVPFGRFLRETNDYDEGRVPPNLSRPAFWGWHVQSWRDRRCLFVSFEQLTQEFPKIIQTIGEFIGESHPEALYSPVRQSRGGVWARVDTLVRRATRALGVSRSTSVSFNKGTSGQWREVFSADDLSYFEEHAGEVNAMLGYR